MNPITFSGWPQGWPEKARVGKVRKDKSSPAGWRIFWGASLPRPLTSTRLRRELSRTLSGRRRRGGRRLRIKALGFKEAQQTPNNTLWGAVMLRMSLVIVQKPLEAFRQALDALRSALVMFRRVLEAFRQSLEALRRLLNALRRALEALRRPLNALRRLLEALRKSLDALRRLLPEHGRRPLRRSLKEGEAIPYLNRLLSRRIGTSRASPACCGQAMTGHTTQYPSGCLL